MKKTGKKIFKFFKWCLLLVLLFMAGVSVYFITGTTVPSSYAGMSHTDRELFSRYAVAARCFRQHPDAIWDSTYDFSTRPLILFSKQRERGFYQTIYLVNTSKFLHTERYRKVHFPDSMQLNDVYATRWLGFKELLLGTVSNFFHDTVSGVPVLVFGCNPAQLLHQKGNFILQFPYFTVHEGFHFYRQRDWTYDKDFDFIENFPTEADFLQLTAHEYMLLDSALTQLNDTVRLKRILSDWVAVREEKYKRWPQVKRETLSETIEGTATYVEHRLATVQGLAYPYITARTQPVVETMSFSDVARRIHEPALTRYLNRRASYDKGDAMGHILDVLYKDWKSHVGPGDNKTLYDLVKTAAGYRLSGMEH